MPRFATTFSIPFLLKPNELNTFQKHYACWLPITCTSHLKELSSLSTSYTIASNKFQSRPRICFIVSENSHGEMGYDELFRQLSYFTIKYLI